MLLIKLTGIITSHNDYSMAKMHHTQSLSTNFFQNRDCDKIIHEIFENIPIGLEIYDRDGKLIYINANALNTFECTDAKSMLGLQLFDNPNLPADVAKDLKAGKDVRVSIEYHFDTAREYYPTQGNKNKNLDIAINVTFDESGAIDKFILISQDNTLQFSLQNKYEMLSNQSSAVLKSLPVGTLVCSMTGDILFINRVCKEIFSSYISQENHILMNIFEYENLPSKITDALRNKSEIKTTFKFSFTKNSSNANDYIYLSCDGTPVIDSKGNTTSYIFIFEDITASKRQEKQIKRSNLKTEIALRDSGITLWEFDAATAMFICDNDPINGYDSLNPLTLKQYQDAMHPDDLSIALDIADKMVAGEDFSFTFEVRMTYPNTPEVQYCTISGLPFEYDTKGRVLKYAGTRKNNTDIFKRKQLLDTILNEIPISIHIKDIEANSKYLFCNKESKRMFGTNENKTFSDVVDEKQSIRIHKSDLNVYKTGDTHIGAERLVLKDGRIYDTIVHKSIIYDDDKRLLLNLRWDQSVQNELERRAKILSLSLKAVNAYSWIYEPSTNTVSYDEGCEQNRKFLKTLNTADKFASHIHPEDAPIFLGALEQLRDKDMGDFDVEYRADLNGGDNYEWWQSKGALESVIRDEVPYKYMFGMSINIDSRKKTELDLLVKKEELNILVQQKELVLNNANSGLVFITPDYYVQWENISTCHASLTYEAYKKGEQCFRSAHGRTEPCENCVMQRAIISGEVEQIKFELDNEHTIEVFATPVISDENVIQGVVVRIDDITKRERTLKTIEHARKMAEESDKLKSAFLANMSHEIRTPLNAIIGFSELLMTVEDEAEKEEYVTIINNNNDLLLKLIGDILDLSKIEAGAVELKYERFDLSEYFDDLASTMKLRIVNPNLRLIVSNPHEKCIVELDKNRIAQIITNYVTNAIKYTPKGFIEMGYETTDNEVRFFVSDTGIGIADDKKCKVFHRFEKLDEFAQGTGLGLSICKAIVESMGGEVGFKSQYHEGSLFWATMPCNPVIGTTRDENNSEKNDLEEEIEEYDAGNNGDIVILVVEDNISNYKLVYSILSKLCRVVHAKNGQQAIDMVKQEKPNLVLMDMKMPVTNGLDATEEIRKFNRKIPIVALTAHAFESDKQAAFNVGCDFYLTKPIDSVKLLCAVRRYCKI